MQKIVWFQKSKQVHQDGSNARKSAYLKVIFQLEAKISCIAKEFPVFSS